MDLMLAVPLLGYAAMMWVAMRMMHRPVQDTAIPLIAKTRPARTTALTPDTDAVRSQRASCGTHR